MSFSKMFYLLGVAATIQVVSSQTVLQSYHLFDSIGCFSDNPTARALHYFVGSSPNMTAESCLAQCSVDDGTSNFVLGGLEFGTECYCGNAILNNQEGIDPSFCNMPCAGNSSEICGGSNAINIYQYGGDYYSSGPGAIVQYSNLGWQFYGCYEDSVTNRQIPYRQAIPPEDMTVENCLEVCNGNFIVAGLQFGQECYCGNIALPPGIAAPNSSCNIQCTDNANEFCGAANLNLVYYIPQLPSGCVLSCPGGIVKQGVFLLLVFTSYNDGILECGYYNEPTISAETCQYSEASGLLISEPGEADCEPSAVVACP